MIHGIPKVVVTDENEIRIGNQYGQHVVISQSDISGLIELLQAASVWAETRSRLEGPNPL